MNHLNFAGDRPLDFIALGRAGVDLYARERDTPLDIGDNIVPLAYFNRVKLKKGETFSYRLEEYESVSVLAAGTCDFDVAGAHFANVGRRASLWAGRPDAVYVPLNTRVTLTGVSAEAEIFIAGGKAETQYKPFRVTPEEVDTVQYGSDDTKTHRKILHILGQNARGRADRLLVSELFTVGAGGWSGFPSHKHDEDREGEETAFQEVYHFRFNPDHGFGAQFAYPDSHSNGPVYRITNGSTISVGSGLSPQRRGPRLRDVLLHYPGGQNHSLLRPMRAVQEAAQRKIQQLGIR